VKKILTAAAAAALLAAPALAQTPSAQTSYDQQIRAIYAQIDSMPNGQKETVDLLHQAMVVKAEAYRHGVMVEVPPRPESTATAANK
jgi:Ni/Co efflux regulator RcnB